MQNIQCLKVACNQKAFGIDKKFCETQFNQNFAGRNYEKVSVGEAFFKVDDNQKGIQCPDKDCETLNNKLWCTMPDRYGSRDITFTFYQTREIP